MFQPLKSSKELARESWGIYKNQFEVLLGVGLIPFAFSLLSSLLFFQFPIPLFVSFMIYLLFKSLAYPALFFVIKDGIGIWGAYQKAYKFIFGYFWLTFLTLFIILGGFVMGIIPGFIFGFWSFLSIFIFLDGGGGGMYAILRSKKYVQGYFGQIFRRLLPTTILIILIALLITIPVNLINKDFRGYFQDLISIFITPFIMIYSYLIYKNLLIIKPDALIIEDQKRGLLILSFVVGFIAFFGFSFYMLSIFLL